LNKDAQKKKWPISKVSCFAAGTLAQDYSLLSVGAALGEECGPKFVAKSHKPIEEMTVAVPGLTTTAYALFGLTLPQPKRIICLPYNHIIDAILSGKADGGVLIHESRFTFPERGLEELADLGTLYIKQYHCPIPLGVFVARKTLCQKKSAAITEAMERSLAYAKSHFEEMLPMMLEHAIEKNAPLITDFINLYVTDETAHISRTGYHAIETFFRACIEKKILPPSSLELLS